jgi:hypothetical protein
MVNRASALGCHPLREAPSLLQKGVNRVSWPGGPGVKLRVFGPIGMEQLWNRGGATGGKRSFQDTPENGLIKRQTFATGYHRLPFGSHGKQGVCPKLPPVAGGPLPEKEEVDLLKTPSPANPKAHRT